MATDVAVAVSRVVVGSVEVVEVWKEFIMIRNECELDT